MPSYRCEEDGSLVIDPNGDIVFSDGICPDDGPDVQELIIFEPGDKPGSGALLPQYTGHSTAYINTLVRIKVNLRTAAILIERLAIMQTALYGMPPLEVKHEQ